jgi:hypothetical protein
MSERIARKPVRAGVGGFSSCAESTGTSRTVAGLESASRSLAFDGSSKSKYGMGKGLSNPLASACVTIASSENSVTIGMELT